MIIRDGDWRLVDYDFHLKRQVWRRENPDGSTTVRTDYAVDDILDANQQARSDAAGTKFGDWARVASIPLNVYHGEGLADAQEQLDGKYFDKWLSENSKFKTR
jgi:hypothetical protein